MKSTTPDPNLTKKTDVGKSEPLSSVLHFVEALAVVMLCNYRYLSTVRLPDGSGYSGEAWVTL